MITSENYFSDENQLKYMGASQFKAFMKCEASALAEIKFGEHIRKKSVALLVGSYVDAHFEGTLDIFIAQHPEILLKSGGLKSDYAYANYIIERIERDPLFMEYMRGEKQVIYTGEIQGVPFKIKIDADFPDKIVDLKVMRDFAPVWSDELHIKRNFVEAWGYDIQGAIYQEIKRQNTGEKSPFIIAGATKEKPEPDIGLFEIGQADLDFAMQEVQENVNRFERIKQGLEKATRCEKCDYCRRTKRLTAVRDYKELDNV